MAFSLPSQVMRFRFESALYNKGTKMNNVVANIFSLIAVSGIVAGCSTSGHMVSPESVSNKTWVLTSSNGILSTDMPKVTIEFKPVNTEQGRVSGAGPCNHYFGGYKYKARGKTLTFTPMGSTMMSCPAPAMQRERDYLVGLEKISKMAMKDSVLVLKDDKGGVDLTFEVKESDMDIREKVDSAKGDSQIDF
ncbi:MAG: META domain-containing protein [Candidatus Endonucleobacter sp. (ex Gigantidas childressi)]|nr:META domain-containing protein [Candidatus Endonucleobacter sp. (ex Gigantidas childressi)]